ncbi:hypothetical protein ACFLSJ_06680 [Verrucomicrobiota bacterium]
MADAALAPGAPGHRVPGAGLTKKDVGAVAATLARTLLALREADGGRFERMRVGQTPVERPSELRSEADLLLCELLDACEGFAAAGRRGDEGEELAEYAKAASPVMPGGLSS